jgi:hypothetical protein
MSEKKRQKKDGERKDKQNERMREAEDNPEQKAIRSQQTKDTPNLADADPDAESNQTSAAAR